MSPELSAFVDLHSFGFDDYQLRACELIEDGHTVLVAAPTGAGKTIAGEFAVHLAVAQGRKCFYTTPIKALSNQKYADLVRRHGAHRVGLLTGDSSINSDAPIVVMTTEVLRNMLYASSPTLDNLGFVVMDEVHYLGDRFRGAVWEEVIIGLADSVQVVALSATVSNAEEFAEWLGEVRGDVEVVLSERRPVPLYQHVMVGKKIHDLFADEAPTAMPDPSIGNHEVNHALVQIAKQESRSVRDDSRNPRGRRGRGKKNAGYGSGRYGGAAHRDRRDRAPRWTPSRPEMVQTLARAELLPAIVFIFSRVGCDAAVGQLLASDVRLTTDQERAEIDAIARRHIEGLSRDDLRALEWDSFIEALSRGVAAHHAGMLPAFKECVEEAFVAGLIKVVFATETLALGINMPARSVVLEKLVKYNGETHADITPGEYTQLTGRAGRRGIDVEGHAVVLWQPGLDPRAVAGLASRRTYPLRSSFAPTYNMTVNMVGRVGRERARTLLEQSFAQFQSDKSVVGLARGITRNTDAAAELWERAACDRGDFAEYARLRQKVSDTEADAARQRRSDRRAEAVQSVLALRPGDIFKVPAGKSSGWAVLIDHGRAEDRADPRPQVMTEDRHVRRLSMTDVPTPVEAYGRVKIPKHFDARDGHSRRSLHAAFQSRLTGIDHDVVRQRRPGVDPAVAERVAELREEIRHHPCHRCPDRESHAREAERALWLERENQRTEAKMASRTNTIAQKFDRICGVLESFGYLSEGGEEVTETGRTLARIYNELDLVAAECIRAGVFDHLSVPQLAAVLSTLVYEARRSDDGRRASMPDADSEAAVQGVRRIWREVSIAERDARLDRAAEIDLGFARAAYGWADDQPLGPLLQRNGLTAGDFVRWVRQVIDFADQIGQAAGPGPLRRQARAVVRAMRRGVVAFIPAEDEDLDDELIITEDLG
ncbi:DEAD/DEAH box helicase [Propionibacteriaceae bacterium Y1700]|uniref:DEAD/DEAH box helicase n=1 Tax=Microlunatus sp. Y1700 TaxID=3418487 RepID=UPI003DA70CCA